MSSPDKSAERIWRQDKLPVVYRESHGKPLLVRLPYDPNNGVWLKAAHRRNPVWLEQFKCWRVPHSWFDEIITECLSRFGSVYVIQPYREQEKCAPACWNAKGFECECSCMGQYHGSEGPYGKWYVISDTFAVTWKSRQLACRLIERRGLPIEIPDI